MTETESTTVVYNVTMDDLLAFGLNHNRNSPTVRKAWRRITVGVPICAFLIGFGLALQTIKELLPAFILALVPSVLLAALYGLHFKHWYPIRVKKMLKQVYAEDKNPGLTGKYILEVDESGFCLTTDFSQTRCSWGKLVRIESEPGYTYLYTGATNGIVVPHASIISGDLRRVMAQIEQHYHPDKLLAQ